MLALTDLRHRLPHLRRSLRRRRRSIALLLAVAGVLTILPAALPPGIRGHEVLVAAAPIPAGETLNSTNMRTVRVSADLVPPGGAPSASTLIGREVSRELHAGAIITASDLADPASTDRPAGSALVAVPVPAALVPHLRHGTRVELIVPDVASGSTRRINAVVIDPPDDPDPQAVPGTGTLDGHDATAVLAVDPDAARDTAHAMAEAWISISVVD